MPAVVLSRMVIISCNNVLAAMLRLVLLGDVERDHRGAIALARGQRRRLHPREQPTLAELGVADGVAHLGALGMPQRVLQPFVFGQ